MIWGRLKKASQEEEEQFRSDFQEAKPGFKDILAMLISAFFTLVVPSALVLIGLSVLVMWMLGVL